MAGAHATAAAAVAATLATVERVVMVRHPYPPHGADPQTAGRRQRKIRLVTDICWLMMAMDTIAAGTVASGSGMLMLLLLLCGGGGVGMMGLWIVERREDVENCLRADGYGRTIGRPRIRYSRSKLSDDGRSTCSRRKRGPPHRGRISPAPSAIGIGTVMVMVPKDTLLAAVTAVWWGCWYRHEMVVVVIGIGVIHQKRRQTSTTTSSDTLKKKISAAAAITSGSLQQLLLVLPLLLLLVAQKELLLLLSTDLLRCVQVKE